jgi:hypothetical protein
MGGFCGLLSSQFYGTIPIKRYQVLRMSSGEFTLFGSTREWENTSETPSVALLDIVLHPLI